MWSSIYSWFVVTVVPVCPFLQAYAQALEAAEEAKAKSSAAAAPDTNVLITEAQ